MSRKSPQARRASTTHAAAQSMRHSHYELSWRGKLLTQQCMVIAPLFTRLGDWEQVRKAALEHNLLQARVYRTGVRSVREVIKRLEVLTPDEISLLPSLTGTDASHLMWAAACRRYTIIGEFAEEVLREHYLTLNLSLTYDDYDAFWRSRSLWHEELMSLTASTYEQLRRWVFGMMREAGLLSRRDAIEPALISPDVAGLLDAQFPSDIRFFPARTAA